MKYFFSVISFISLGTCLFAQTKEGSGKADGALEGIIVEKYYVADEKDIADTSGGSLPKGSVTYRIYVDMKPGYKLQAVYGVTGHDLIIKTTTTFFNNRRGGKTGDLIDDKAINENTLALDSWLTMGSATKSHFGVIKADDRDGSVIKRATLDKADGLTVNKPPALINYLLDLGFFEDAKAPSLFFANNGSLAAFSSVQGLSDDNKVLIAQLTTNGKLSFELNLQVGTPNCTVENYVARNPVGSEISFGGLIYGQ